MTVVAEGSAAAGSVFALAEECAFVDGSQYLRSGLGAAVRGDDLIQAKQLELPYVEIVVTKSRQVTAGVAGMVGPQQDWLL